MWFLLSIFAMTMLVARRTTERRVVHGIDSLALTWLQQAFALPFIIATLFFAKFYLPSELGVDFWSVMAVYVVLGSIDLYLYFKALSLADISLVMPLLSLAAVGNVAGAYLVLGQRPSLLGIMGATLVVAGVYFIHKAKQSDSITKKSNALAVWCVLLILPLRAIGSNIEVFMLRESNPTTFNFYSSLMTVGLVLTISYLLRPKRKQKHEHYWPEVRKGVFNNKWPLVLIGLSYMLNLTATYQAKLLSSNAGYVGAVKASGVLPIVLIGVFFFKEKFVKAQWFGLILILVGLAALATN